MDRKAAEIAIIQGREFDIMFRSKGFQQILLPRLKQFLIDADKKCHDFKLRNDYGKYAVVEYNTLKKVMDLFDNIYKEMDRGLEYCRNHNINV